MLFVAVLTLLALSVRGDNPVYSFVPPVGSGTGTSFAITGEGRITAIRVWERYSNYITGFQFCYGYVWSEFIGHKEGEPHEFQLFDGEAIIQISGKYGQNIQSVIFVTNEGRSFFVGQPSGHSFNMYPTNKEAELCFLSGSYHGAITSLATHWAKLNLNPDDTENY